MPLDNHPMNLADLTFKTPTTPETGETPMLEQQDPRPAAEIKVSRWEAKIAEAVRRMTPTEIDAAVEAATPIVHDAEFVQRAEEPGLPENLAELDFPTLEQDPREADTITPNRTEERPRQKPPKPHYVQARSGQKINLNDPETQRLLERFKPMSLEEIASLPPPKWLIKRFLPENGLACIYGEPSSGKSFIALAWALCMATGRDWLGRKTEPGDVVYVYAEGTPGINKRTQAWRKENGVAELPSRFHAIPCAVSVTDPNVLDHVILALQQAEIQPQLIVLDTLARCLGGGDENSNKDMGAFIRACDELREEFDGATILIVHHVGKEASKRLRGATALGGAMDIVFQLKKPDKDRPLAVLVNRAPLGKPHKDSATLEDLALEFAEIEIEITAEADDDDNQNTSLVARLANIDAVKEIKVEKGRRPNQKTLEALSAFPRGATYAEWCSASGKSEAAFKRHRKELIAQKLVEQDESGRYHVVEVDPEELLKKPRGELLH